MPHPLSRSEGARRADDSQLWWEHLRCVERECHAALYQARCVFATCTSHHAQGYAWTGTGWEQAGTALCVCPLCHK